ncbi:thioesterase superfamily protein [Spizellomyces punctatus DAOM BR117]|uniref:Thioesterase superfamily protein n=1 Tax=Spizellomyces punctatus (strain DAOM BR117) TaxID=645134 RepID=A0A0L0HFX8_SPIPD|nr:thioesterase superfamily protein [Spizellomyces punctatus DAOM BR117]KND00396.1 thioesterase superfamily protein [Spizellomyces punctatus DAOM BR117]|eukprot:XP_016608435.1 thioesterase superfamily protein [Spizellomyces punctatus DAOM BR117]
MSQAALRRTRAIASHLVVAPTGSQRCISTRPPVATKPSLARERTVGFYKYWIDINTRYMFDTALCRLLCNISCLSMCVANQCGNFIDATYYTFFDTVVNSYLITHCNLKPSSIRTPNPEPIFYVISSQASYHAPASFPEKLRAGMAVAKVGTTSVVYKVGVFKQVESGEWTCAVSGEFVHVCVDSRTGRPLPMVNEVKEGLEKVVVDQS